LAARVSNSCRGVLAACKMQHLVQHYGVSPCSGVLAACRPGLRALPRVGAALPPCGCCFSLLISHCSMLPWPACGAKCLPWVVACLPASWLRLGCPGIVAGPHPPTPCILWLSSACPLLSSGCPLLSSGCPLAVLWLSSGRSQGVPRACKPEQGRRHGECAHPQHGRGGGVRSVECACCFERVHGVCCSLKL
jgi:hypothetical protein